MNITTHGRAQNQMNSYRNTVNNYQRQVNSHQATMNVLQVLSVKIAVQVASYIIWDTFHFKGFLEFQIIKIQKIFIISGENRQS